MSLKRWLTGAYLVLWVLFALFGWLVCSAMSGEPSKYPEANAAWGCWPVVCFALPAGLLWLVKKIASSVRRDETIEPPPQPQVPRPPAMPRPMTSRERFREAYWPLVYDEASAKRAAHQAAWAAFFGSGVSGVLAYLAIFKVVPTWLSAFAAPEGVLDLVIFATLGYLILTKVSRGAAVAALICHAIGLVYMFGQARGTGSPVSGGAIVFTALYATGVRGAFAYHRYRKAAASEPSVARAA